MAFLEVSALDGVNVDLAFYRLINGMRADYLEIYQLINKQSLAENGEQVQSIQSQKVLSNQMKSSAGQNDSCCK